MENKKQPKIGEDIYTKDNVSDEDIETILASINDGVSEQDQVSRDEITDEIHKRRRAYRISKTLPQQAEEATGFKTGYTFEASLEEFDPKETQPQVSEFWKYTSGNLNRQGRF